MFDCRLYARPFLLSLLLLIANATAAPALPAPRGTWFPSVGPPRAVALLIHGLNLKPEKMDPLARVLVSEGIEVFRASLSGNGFGSLAEVTASGWLEECAAAYRAVAARSGALGVPVYLVGYSLGGLLGETLLAESAPASPVHFDRVVLLAPAIALRPIVYLVKAFFLLGRGFELPSADRPSYRAHRATAMAAYEALFRLRSMLQDAHFRRTNVPTLVLVRRDDELVSLNGLRSAVRKYNLSNWTISVIPGRGVPGYPHHLIIDEPSLGPVDWAWLTSSLTRELLGPRR